MRRGAKMKPYRPPAGGFSTFPNPNLYSHQEPALNNLPRFQNNTQITLQPNQVGRPMTRGAVVNITNCEAVLNNGLPNGPWIGPGSNQGVPPVLGGVLTNTFQQNGTNSLGLNCRLRGGKWVQAVRQWHGAFPFTSKDAVADCLDGYCLSQTTDGNGNNPGDSGYVPTYTNSPYQKPQTSADESKYCTVAFSDVVLQIKDTNSSNQTGIVNSTLGGSVSVDPAGGKITSSLSSSEDSYYADLTTAQHQLKHAVNGAGWMLDGFLGGVPAGDSTGKQINYAKGMGTLIDGLAGFSPYCTSTPGLPDGAISGADTGGQTLEQFVTNWNSDASNQTKGWLFAWVSDPNSYSSTMSYTNTVGMFTTHDSITVQWTRTATSFTFLFKRQFFQTSSDPVDYPPSPVAVDNLFSGTITLSGENTSASVYADTTDLLGYWPLNDDALYPPRTDGIWQVAPLVSRDERELDVSPLGNGFIPATVDDLRLPITDQNGNAPWTSNANPPPPGWHYAPNNNDSNGRPPSDPNYGGPASWNQTYTQMPWFDDNAYGWQFPLGFGMETAPATALVQYGCTGLICGMPMPRAFTDPNSYWYVAGFSAPTGATFQNFFDYRAQIYRACEWFDENGGGPYVDFYLYGYGEWLYDAITRTGAQLPHCATQWTNNAAAQTKPPYAYLIQADLQKYDWQGLTPGPSSDFTAYRASAIWAQKCMEIPEVWPSQDFGRPGGSDRFALDQTQVYCVAGGGSTWTLADTSGNPPASLTLSGIWGGASVGGFYTGCSYAGGTLALGSKVSGVPSDWVDESGDAASAFGPLRFPTAPPILGRAAVASVTDLGTSRQLVLSTPCTTLGLGTAADTVDICAADMTVLASAVAVTRADDSTFTVATALATIAAAKYIVSHGAPAWYWDDNLRKGDFVAMQWLYDYRTNGQVSDLANMRDCSENQPPAGSPSANYGFAATSALSAACTSGNALSWDSAAFSAAGKIEFLPCCPMVVAITPNGETWTNGVVIPFPATFTFDDRYGARWQAELETAMTDLLWHAPHTPCSVVNPLTDDTVSGSSIIMEMDDGSCKVTYSDDSGAVHFVYAHAPLVEARITLPSNGGNGQNETAPALPTGITIGYASPVTNAGGLQPPGQIGYDPASGNPASAWTFWGYRLTLENHACVGGCDFDYVGMENLPCLNSYAPPEDSTAADSNTNTGSTGSGLT